MQTSTKAQPKTIQWIVALAVGIVAMLFIWNATNHGGKKTITSPSEYNEALAEGEKLSKKHFDDLDQGLPLTEQDKADLRKASEIFDSLADYQPSNIAPYMLAGKAYQALGQDDLAIRRLQQGISTVPKNLGNSALERALLDTSIECHYLLSVSLLHVGRYDSALNEINAAISGLHDVSPIYLTQRASVYVQLANNSKQGAELIKAANADLDKALSIDPNYVRAKALLKFIVHDASDTAVANSQALLNKKDYKGAVAATTTALEIDPERPQLLAIRAAAYIQLKEKAKAKADVDKLAEVSPNDPDVKTLRSMLK